jgi:NADH:ubiquinone oxidoreductase subunit
MQPEWQGWISYTINGIEHRILRVEHGWKLRIQDRHTGKLLHEENGCREIGEAQARDRAWNETQKR